MTFTVRALAVAALATLVALTSLRAYDNVCPKPRFTQIGNTPDGRVIVVFDACLGVAYATPVIGLQPPPVQKQKDIEV